MKEKRTYILDTLPDCIRIVGRDKKVLWVNRGFEKLIGKDKQELCGDDCHIHLCPERMRGEEGCYFDIIDRGNPVPQREITLKDNGGKNKVFLASYTPYRNEASGVTGVVEYLREITNLTQTRTALEEQLLHSKTVLGKTVDSLVSAIESRDPYTAGHQRKVSQLVRKIAQAMKPEDRRWIEGLRVSAQLHDIGKICVPAEILSHPGKLGHEQFELIKLHSETGYRILSNIEFTFGFPFTNAILQHHERMDGTGYPNGLPDSEIILEARILAVADVMEAMVNHRPYRAGLGITCALDEITKNAGSKYDPEVAEACRGIFLEDKFEFREVLPIS